MAVRNRGKSMDSDGPVDVPQELKRLEREIEALKLEVRRLSQELKYLLSKD
jgi:archaellum component FlaC